MSTQTMSNTRIIQSTSLLPETTSTNSQNQDLSTEVSKPTPYNYDLPHLVITDPNPIPPPSTNTDLNPTLQYIARDAAQTLISTFLTTLPIQSTEDGLLMTIPQPSNNEAYKLPRFKPLPKPKAATKWETFAKKKGIGRFNSTNKGDNKQNLVYDEEKGEWVRKWGYKGKNKEGENDWLVEVDEKKSRQENGDQKNVRELNRRERMEKGRRQDRRQRRNGERDRRSGQI